MKFIGSFSKGFFLDVGIGFVRFKYFILAHSKYLSIRLSFQIVNMKMNSVSLILIFMFCLNYNYMGKLKLLKFGFGFPELYLT